MRGEPIRILHVLGGVNLGGAESRIMELYRKCNRDIVQFDFMVHTRERGYFQDEIESLGGKVYHISRFNLVNLIKYKSEWKEFFNNHKYYTVVHGHMTSTAALYLPIASKNGVKLTIAHARSAGVDKGIKGIVTRLLRRNLYKKCDICIACSKEAAKAVFPKNKDTIIIPNGINTCDFIYDINESKKLKRELKIDGKYVLGHVGRFHSAKNHEFLIDVFSEYNKLNDNSVLVLLGEGSLVNSIKEKVSKLALDDKVLFLGNRNPISEYLQIIDYFVFPSIYEGMPGSVVEAQAMGIKCLVSENVTRDVKLCDLVEFMSINDSAYRWAEFINNNCIYERRTRADEIKQAGFDVSSQLEKLMEIYN